MKALSLAAFAALSITRIAEADSPLTSTDFASAYRDRPEVVRATRGASEQVFADLSNPATPNDVRAAIVNELRSSCSTPPRARFRTIRRSR
jgi:hypothetical protein